MPLSRYNCIYFKMIEQLRVNGLAQSPISGSFKGSAGSCVQHYVHKACFSRLLSSMCTAKTIKDTVKGGRGEASAWFIENS